jgi:uracil-DNA glycosylase
MKESWRPVLAKFDQTAKCPIPRILEIVTQKRETLSGHLNIYPETVNIFKCLNYCDIDKIKVVIIGQDPYHGEGQATGLSFAVESGVKIPPSLRNIKEELRADLGIDLHDTSLEHWAKQGVLLLNASLSVLQGRAGSQLPLWTKLTDHIISELNIQDNIVFVAWGAFAYNKFKLIDINRHKLIVSSHPSPLSYYKQFKEYPAFKGSKPFSKINEYLKTTGAVAIEW